MTTLKTPDGLSPARVALALMRCQEIAARDRSNLYQVSQFFEQSDRYEAFIAMYAAMRVIDDLVDSVPDRERLDAAERRRLHAELDDWHAQIQAAYQDRPESDLSVALCAAVATFPVPQKLWDRFIAAMHFDLERPRFSSFAEFLEYCEGATVAPTAIYVFLLSAVPTAAGHYSCPTDFENAGRELGIFAYLTHIMRDLVRDLQTGERGLLYISLADLEAHELPEVELRALALRGETDARFCKLMRTLCLRAAEREQNGERLLAQNLSKMPRDCAFILRLIVSLYAEMRRRIYEDPAQVLRPQPLLSADDYERLIAHAAEHTGYAGWRQPRVPPTAAWQQPVALPVES